MGISFARYWLIWKNNSGRVSLISPTNYSNCQSASRLTYEDVSVEFSRPLKFAVYNIRVHKVTKFEPAEIRHSAWHCECVMALWHWNASSFSIRAAKQTLKSGATAERQDIPLSAVAPDFKVCFAALILNEL